MAYDRTRTAVHRHLKALGSGSFEVSILRGTEHRSVTVWSDDEIIARLDRLKRANKAGAHIYIRRPRDADHDLILLDDIEAFTPDRMKESGHDPAAVLETSPGSFQAWLRLGTPCSRHVRLEISRILSRKYSGDPAATGADQSGRLAGFTNQKPRHRTVRGAPFVLLRSGTGTVAPAAAGLIDQAGHEIAAADLTRPPSQRTRVPTTASFHGADVDASSSAAARDLEQAWLQEYRTATDLSRTDWATTNAALGHGVDPAMIIATLAVVATRKGDYARQYAERTVAAALEHRSSPSP